MHHGRIALTCLAIAAFLLMLMGCASQATVLRVEGFNAQWQGFRSLDGEPFGIHEADINVRVIVVEDRADIGYNAAGTYSHPQGIIRIVGKKINGKIVTSPSVLGHEVQHALEYQGDGFVNPDRLADYGY